MRTPLILLAAAGFMASATSAMAEPTVECVSHHHNYNECKAGPLKRPVLIRQVSNSTCIMNRTWGYNPKSGYIWVGAGCGGIFADNHGYHHGKPNTSDKGARHYDTHGHDNGSAVGALLGAAIIGALLDDNEKHHEHKHHSSNRYPSDGPGFTVPNDYDGCHGTGCLVDRPN